MRLDDFALIVFDMDGVLLDTATCHARAYGDLWTSIGIDGPSYETIAGRATRDVVVELTAGLRPTPGQIDGWVNLKQESARRYLATEPILFDDALHCLEAVSAGPPRLALGTSASRATATLLLERFGMTRFFSFVRTADEVVRGKPSPEIYRTLMVEAGVRAGGTLIVEDSEPGLRAAVASGGYVVSVRTGRRLDSPSFLGSFASLRELSRSLGPSDA